MKLTKSHGEKFVMLFLSLYWRRSIKDDNARIAALEEVPVGTIPFLPDSVPGYYSLTY